MKRILILLASLLVVGSYHAGWTSSFEKYGPSFGKSALETLRTYGGVEFNEFADFFGGYRIYVRNCDWPSGGYGVTSGYGFCVLALSEDGAYGHSVHVSLDTTKNGALTECRKYAQKPETCIIVDVNLKSEFYLSGALENYLAPNPTNGRIWCSARGKEWLSTVKLCAYEGGKAFDSQSEARDESEKYQVESSPLPPPFEPNPAPIPSPTPKSKPKHGLIGTGTGFVINKGYIVTAEHVVDGCSSVSVVLGSDEIKAQTIATDENNDLALLRFISSARQVAVLRQSDLRMGESAINFGYPLAGVLSRNPQITAGYVSSLAGYKNNSAFFQYSAPTQFGNSGGPVLDASGNVIGVVSGKLDDADNQLVNFATKSTILEGFLKANKVPFEKADLGDKLELPDIAEKAETFTVLVGCWE
jgi:S1-C subfamily serine protease